MLTKMHIHRESTLWKRAVEKPVENVENYEFSTGIWDFSPRRGNGAMLNKRLHNLLWGVRLWCYVAGLFPVLFSEKSGKKLATYLKAPFRDGP